MRVCDPLWRWYGLTTEEEKKKNEEEDEKKRKDEEAAKAKAGDAKDTGKPAATPTSKADKPKDDKHDKHDKHDEKKPSPNATPSQIDQSLPKDVRQAMEACDKGIAMFKLPHYGAPKITSFYIKPVSPPG